MEEEQVTIHCREIHGLLRGMTSLSPLEIIQVEEELKFVCQSLLKIEELGEESLRILADSIYSRCVTGGVVISTVEL